MSLRKDVLGAVACLLVVHAPELRATDSTYRFEARDGKIIGLWPDIWTPERLNHLRTRYGFNYLAVPGVQGPYEAALAAGYPPERLQVLFSYGNGPTVVDHFPAAMYYVDEAVEHNCAGAPTAGPIHSPQELAALRDYIHQHRPGALFVSSGYKRCSHLRILGEFVDRIMFSSYVHWAELTTTYCTPRLGWGDSSEVAFIPIAYDQSPSWSAMRTLFGPKFSMTWIRGREDEYEILLPHANALGVNGLWLYHGEPIDTMLLVNFCTAAWRNGWMTRIAETPLSHLSVLTAARFGENRVRLQWATQQELDHRGYVVERRAENESEFAIVPDSFVPRRGAPGTPQEYAFVDSSAPTALLLYRLRLIDRDSTVRLSHPVQISPATEVKEHTPISFELFQNAPNPFNPTTRIAFHIPASSAVTLKLYDMLGRELRTLVNEVLPAGRHERVLEATNLPSGVYVYRLTAGAFSDARKLVIIR